MTADEANQLSALAFSAVSEGVIITDGEQRALLVNPAFEAITGYEAAEMIGHNCNMLQGPLSDPTVVRAMSVALGNHETFSGEVLNYRKDGSTFWNDLSISPLRDAEGKVTHFIGLMRDINERKRQEAALVEGEIRYQHATEAAGGYIMDVDTEFRFTFVSQGVERLLGFAPSEMMGHTPADFMPPGEIERVNAWFKRNLRKDGSIHSLEHRMLSKSGVNLWLQVSRLPLKDTQGTTIGYRAIAFDITARKQAEVAEAEREIQTRESQKMEAIGTLAGGIAHDFNNIIAAILGNVNLARQDVSAASPAQESLQEIHKAASRARDLVRQILAFSRQETTRYQPTALAPIVQETGRMLRAMMPARVAINVHCAPEAPMAAADASQIQQAIINLATNAMQALGSQPGQITIGLDAVTQLSAKQNRHLALREMLQRCPNGMLCVSVADNGPGIGEPILARIFEPFFTTKAVGEGTGLGLAVVHGIAQGHQGIVVVDSELGVGTNFQLYLPIDITEVEPELATPSLAPEEPKASVTEQMTGRKLHIVYVDDDDALVFLVRRLLERRGYRVSVFQEPRAALQAMAADPADVDLFLTDYNMPDMSGLDLARQVRAVRADLPIGIASGFVDESLYAQAAEAGVHSLIFKATSAEEFCSAIEALLPAPL